MGTRLLGALRGTGAAEVDQRETGAPATGWGLKAHTFPRQASYFKQPLVLHAAQSSCWTLREHVHAECPDPHAALAGEHREAVRRGKSFQRRMEWLQVRRQGGQQDKGGSRTHACIHQLTSPEYTSNPCMSPKCGAWFKHSAFS